MTAGRDRAARNLTRGSMLAADVELARSFWARFMGLMGRASLPADHGLWISGSNGIHMFFMRFAIDAVFLSKADRDGTRAVVAVRRSLAAWTGLVPFVRGSDSVLELPVGAIDGSGTQVGDRVQVA